MRKLIYIFLLSVSIVFFAGCLKNSPQIAGAAGATGATGSQGGDFINFRTFINLSAGSFKGATPNYYYKWVFSGKPNTTYMVSAYVSKINQQGQALVWNKLPYLSAYESGDALSTTLTGDTVKIWYTNNVDPFPTDSIMKCTIIVIPQQ